MYYESKGDELKNFQEFMDWDAMMARCNDGSLLSESGKSRMSSVNQTPKNDWDYGVGWQGAMDLALTGWNDKVQKFRLSSEPMLANLRPEYIHDYCGDEVDIDRYLAGEAECFLRANLSDSIGIKPVVSICIDVVCSSGTPAKTINLRGQAVMGMIDALEKAGKAVDVWACNIDDNGPMSMIRVKSAHEYVPVSRLIFALCHPAFSRRIYFRMLECWPEKVFHPIMYGYGRTYQQDKKRADFPEWVDYFSPGLGPNTMSKWTSVESARAEIRRAMKEVFKLELE